MSLRKTIIVFPSLYTFKKKFSQIQDARGDNQVKDKKLSAQLKTQSHFVKAWHKLGWQFLTCQSVQRSDFRIGNFDSSMPS